MISYAAPLNDTYLQARNMSAATLSEPKPPLIFKLVGMLPWLQRVPARLLGIGIRPEHVRTPDAGAAA